MQTLFRSFVLRRHYPDGLKKKALFLAQMFEMLTAKSGDAILRQVWLASKVKMMMTIDLSSTQN